jgi:hypothetical protein
MHRFILALLALFAAGVAAQTPQNVELPTSNPVPLSNNYPFGGPSMRYQLWYSAAEWRLAVGRPVRVSALAFRAFTPGGQAGHTVNLEVTMANSFATVPTTGFESNMLSGRTTVYPRAALTTAAATPGTYPVAIPFSREFTWDGRSGVVVDIKLYDNGNSNRVFPYDLESTVSGLGRIFRMYTVGDVNSNFAVQAFPGEGLRTRFTFFDGVSVSFGDGCPGEGGVVPVASTSGGHPRPANAAWTQRLDQAPSQRSAVWLFGLSATMWDQTPLPFDLRAIGAAGCFLRVEPLVGLNATTVGGGAGAGSASINVPLPPVTVIVGLHCYSQWLVVDPLAPNGRLCASNALWHVIGP